MKMVNLKINNMPVSVPEGTTILEAARQIGVNIPTLCFLKDINEIGACRICVVEVKGARSLVASCVYPVSEGMEVQTNSPKVMASRKTTLELILSSLTARISGMTLTTAPSICTGTTTSASFAAGAWPPARSGSRWRLSAPTTGASVPTSAAPLMRTWGM